jgi:hypothetical protein
VLYNDAVICQNAKDGGEMSGLAYFLLYDVCPQSVYHTTMQQARDSRLTSIKQRVATVAMLAAYYNPADEESFKLVVFQHFHHTCCTSYPHFFKENKSLNEIGKTFIKDFLMNQVMIKKPSTHAINSLIEQGYNIWTDQLFQTLSDAKMSNATMYNDFMVQLHDIVESQVRKSLNLCVTEKFCDEKLKRLILEISVRVKKKLHLNIKHENVEVKSGLMETFCDCCKLIMCADTCHNCCAFNK